MTTLAGFDVSKWQAPSRFDWTALRRLSNLIRSQGGPGFLFIARASYGATGPNARDPHFRAFADLARENELCFGAYHFMRQTEDAEAQLETWDAQLHAIGGLRPGELVPMLDLEENDPISGDGPVHRRIFNDVGRAMAEAWRAQYGRVILYYSSLFPHLEPWTLEDGYDHLLADYSSAPGSPRAPLKRTPPPGKPNHAVRAILHQANPSTTPLYRYQEGRSGLVDHLYLAHTTMTADLNRLVIPAPAAEPIDVSSAPQAVSRLLAEAHRHVNRVDEILRAAREANGGVGKIGKGDDE